MTYQTSFDRYLSQRASGYDALTALAERLDYLKTVDLKMGSTASTYLPMPYTSRTDSQRLTYSPRTDSVSLKEKIEESTVGERAAARERRMAFFLVEP